MFEVTGNLWTCPAPAVEMAQFKWEDVRPVLTFLPDNVKVITFG